MARLDLRESLHGQISDSIAQGAVAVTGCNPLEREGCFYQPSFWINVTAKTRAYQEELFGPVAIVMRAAGRRMRCVSPTEPASDSFINLE